MNKERRSYQRTSFWYIPFCVVVTLVLEHYGVTAEQVVDYAQGVLTKTFHNIAVFALFGQGVLIWVSERFDDYQKRKHARDIEIERIRAGQDNRPISE